MESTSKGAHVQNLSTNSMVSYGRAEYPRVFDRGGQVEIAKFDRKPAKITT